MSITDVHRKFKVGDELIYKTNAYTITIIEVNGHSYILKVNISAYDGKDNHVWSHDVVHAHFRKLTKLDKALK